MNKRYPSNSGFSLVELTVVLLIITLLASVAVRETSELAFQTRYEQTKERLDMIRQAILGNPRQIINGQQAVSGFVADMGRLPVDLHELLEREYCRPNRDINWKNNPTDADTVCDTNNGVGSWVTNPPYKSGYCLNGTGSTEAACVASGSRWIALGFGWHGPYLNVSGSPADADVFPDGWGSLAPDAPNAQTQNYGWVLVDGFDINTPSPHPTNSNRLVVQSYGKDQQVGGADYDADYPENRYSVDNSLPYTQPAPLVDQEDWLVDISGGITINLLKPHRSIGGYCGFLAAQASSFTTDAECKNAGGSWAAGTSTCTINASSCKDLGGKWQSCFFTSTQCISFAGGTWEESCEFTPLSCSSSGGTWNSATRVCDFTSATCPAPATWNGSSCVFTENSCLNNTASGANGGGSWQSQCKFSNQIDCEKSVATGGPGGSWDAQTPASCSFSTVQCDTAGGISNGRDCYATHQEGNVSVSPYNQYSCQIESKGSWFYYTIANAANFFNQRSICMVVWYRDQAASISYLKSSPATLEENGSYQVLRFANFTDQANNEVAQIPISQNAIGIYEYDGTCNPTNPLYPADRQNPIQVDFHPHTTLPVINW